MFIEQIKVKLNSFLTKTYYEQVCLLLFAFLVASLTKSNFSFHFISVPILVIAISSLFVEFNLAKNKVFWCAALLLMLMTLIEDWTIPANHDYLLIYFIIAILLSTSKNGELSDRRISYHTMCLFALTFLLAGFQKLLSPQFMDGSFLSFAFHTDNFNSFILNKIPFLSQEFQENETILKELLSTDPNLGKIAVLGYQLKESQPIFKYVSWGVVGIEFFVGIFAFIKMKSHMFLWLVLVFLVAIFFVRPEGFICVMLILAWPHLPKKNRALQYVFLLAIVSILSLIIMNNAYR
ncbi:MAG: hypothetical protein HOH13_05895 [Crocinitomicaceae bacterium]|jgi:hypothetical protein|nr:hypothetical protein [Crocinitomicaceae bacterium]MBT6029818.1 hypothetical protein [Crocinitomicaceae bacterium]